MTRKKAGKMGILVGGGPAPGINSVIAAATIRAALMGVEVVGIRDGFRWIMRGKTTEVLPLSIDIVSRIHFRGGSVLGTARDNPTLDAKYTENMAVALDKLGVDKLVTIGGDDTAFSAMTLERHAHGRIRVVHVPKTIDNDLDLPHGVNTFGYQTARHVGVGLVKNLMIDAHSTGRWYFVISMGRKAGHLALGIGKAAGATATIIPEEFAEREIRLAHVADILAGTIIKRLSENRSDGVAIIAEGIIERLRPGELAGIEEVGHDAHGHIRLGEIHFFAPVLRARVSERLVSFGLHVPIATKDIGYELRCAEPIPYDLEYTRDLGFCAAQFIINGGTAAMVSIDEGRFKPIYFKNMIDAATQRPRVRMVRIDSEYYHIARRYMLRLHASDFEDEEKMAKCARVCGITSAQFRKEFYYLVENDPLNRTREPKPRGRQAIEDVMTPF
jgi:6-phosphofructokinase 1